MAYIESILYTKSFKIIVNRVIKKVKHLQPKLKIDAIACRGVSGSSVAFATSYVIGLPIIYVRKPTENSHGDKIESCGASKHKNYIIIDDFIDTGTTVKEIIKSIKTNYDDIVCVGVLLYDEHAKRTKVDLSGNESVRVYRTKPVSAY